MPTAACGGFLVKSRLAMNTSTIGWVCDYALELGAAASATLFLVEVVERFDIELTPAEQAKILAGAKRELERTARLLLPHVREVETLVVCGTPWLGIEVAARDIGADLIVIGTHGRRGIERALLGSVAAHVLKTSSVPVTMLPEYVAICRNDAGDRLAAALERLHLEQPNVVARSRSALTVATALAERAKGTVDRATRADACVYRDDVLPSDIVAMDLPRTPRPHARRVVTSARSRRGSGAPLALRASHAARGSPFRGQASRVGQGARVDGQTSFVRS